jgi:hypothetical protein
MKKKQWLVITVLLLVVIGVPVFSGQTQESDRPQTETATSRPAEELPEHVPYMFLFHHVKFLKEQAEEIERQGKGKSNLLTQFRVESSLSDEKFQLLKEVALDCEREVAALDKKAEVIINAFRERISKDETLRKQKLQPPPELIAMQQERNAIILRARDRIRMALGEEEFTDFHGFVRNRIAANARRVRPN